MEIRQQFENFFKLEEVKAYRIVYAQVQQREDALDIVQQAMLKLVKNYAHKDSNEWPLLFYRILQNAVKDHYKKSKFNQLFSFFQAGDSEPDHEMNLNSKQIHPEDELHQSQSLKVVSKALKNLPLRQQQTFVLRAWKEFSIKETAALLVISEGSVKTHYSRAIQNLSEQLETHKVGLL